MMSVTQPEVLAVVVTFNSARYVEALLDSLPDATNGLKLRTVVVDNGSTDNTVELLCARRDCEVVLAPNRGYGAGLNYGVRVSPRTDYVLALNPDATLDFGSVERMALEFGDPRIGIVAPMTIEGDGGLCLSLRREPTLGRVGGLSFTKRPFFSEIVYDREAYGRRHAVDWVVGAVMLISRKCWDDLKGFDESYFLYSEETDFCLRARDRGWATVYTPKARVVHIGGGSGESTRTHVMKMVNRVRIFSRRNGRVKVFAYYLISVLTELRRAILGHKPSWEAARALLLPSRRPSELNCSDRLIPG